MIVAVVCLVGDKRAGVVYGAVLVRAVGPGACFKECRRCPASDQEATVHYPKRVSRIKRKRSIGFRARMRTRNGRKMLSRKRRAGRSVNSC